MGDVSSITVSVFIVTTGTCRAAFKESGVFVTPDMFSISMSGLLSPSIDRPVTGEGGGGMNKGGGEFSWVGEGVVPVDLRWRVGDAAGACGLVRDVGVCGFGVGFGA